MIINMNGAKAPETPSSVLQEKTVTPETLPTVIGPDEGYDGLSQVTVNPDSQLIPTNIRSGKTVFGVTGTFGGESGGIDVSNLTWIENLANGSVLLSEQQIGPAQYFDGGGELPSKGDMNILSNITHYNYGTQNLLKGNWGLPLGYSSYVPSSYEFHHHTDTIPSGTRLFNVGSISGADTGKRFIGEGYLIPNCVRSQNETIVGNTSASFPYDGPVDDLPHVTFDSIVTYVNPGTDEYGNSYYGGDCIEVEVPECTFDFYTSYYTTGYNYDHLFLRLLIVWGEII